MRATEIVLVILSVLAEIGAENATSTRESVQKVYVCPRHFVKIARRCYFFSKNIGTWHEAFYQCRDRKSNIAIIKTPNQDRRIRKILKRPTHAPRERWLGGMYDWKQKKWLWASSGKPLSYQGFASKNGTDNQNWHCIIMDPQLDYKWNTRLCMEKKPYICHTKSKLVWKDPESPYINEIPLSMHRFDFGQSEVAGYSKYDNRIPGFPRRQKRRRKGKKKKGADDTTIVLQRPVYKDTGTRERRYHNNQTTGPHPTITIDTIKYQMYKDTQESPNSLYPKPIVEEYSYLNKG